MSLVLSYDLMHLTHGMCGASHAAMLGHDFMKITRDCIRLIQDHFSAENIGRAHFYGLLLYCYLWHHPYGNDKPYFLLCKVYPNGLRLCMIYPRWAKDCDDLPHP